MKKSKKKIFLNGIVRSMIYVLFFFLLFLFGYKITALYLSYNHKSANTKHGTVNITQNGTAPNVSFNLLFAIDEDAGCMKHMVLEVLNTHTDNLSYITIPLKSKITISSEFYNEIRERYPEMPQIIDFQKLGNYMEIAEFYEFSESVIEDYLNVDISYFTIVQNDDFNYIFKKDKTKECYVLRNQVINEVKDFTEDKMISYLQDFYEKTVCNISMKNRLKYAPSLSQIKVEGIGFSVIPGNWFSGTFTIDKMQTKELFTKLKNGDNLNDIGIGVTEPVSLGKAIRIMNGSGATGLAAGFRGILTKAGYTVTGIANYERTDVEKTVIQVREEGLGVDLLPFFKSAELEMSQDMPENTEIQIILGTLETEID